MARTSALRLSVLLLPLVALAACSTERESLPARTATEQLLISKAADNASAGLTAGIPVGTKAFIDDSHFEGTDSKYAVAAIRDSLLKQGVAIVDDKAKAQAIIDLRSGALSIDQNSLIIGIPSITIPIPLAGPFTTPELALYGSHQSKGVAKFGTAAYDAQTGVLEHSTGPVYGFSQKTQRTILFFFSWTTEDYLPKTPSRLGFAPAPKQADAVNASSSTATTSNSSSTSGSVPKLPF